MYSVQGCMCLGCEHELLGSLSVPSLMSPPLFFPPVKLWGPGPPGSSPGIVEFLHC